MPVPVVTVLNDGVEMDRIYELMSLDITTTFNKVSCANMTLLDSGDQSTALEFLDASDNDFFKPGSKFEVKLRYLDKPKSADVSVFTGVMVKHRVKSSIKGAFLSLCFEDAVIGMTKIRRNIVYREDITDKEIAEEIIGRYDNVSAGTIDSGSYKHERMVQYYTTDWDFFLSRASANGKLVINDSGTLSVVEPEINTTAKVTFDFSTLEYYSFDMEIDICQQIPAVETDNWDVTTQVAAKQERAQVPSSSQGSLSIPDMSAALGIPLPVRLQSYVDMPEAETLAWANARLTKSFLSLYRGTLKLVGRSDIKVGDTVEFKGLSKRFNGKLLITGVRHQLNVEGWQTYLQYGLGAGWLKDIRTMTDVDAAGLLPGVNGLQIGIVQEFVKDESGKFRILVEVPAFSSGETDDKNLVWARLGKFDAGSDRGAFFQPEKDDEVILGFFNNDPRQAVILGAMHSPPKAPPADVLDENNSYKFKGMIVDTDSQLRFDSSDENNKLVQLRSSATNEVLLQEGGDAAGITANTEKDLYLKPKTSVSIATGKTDIESPVNITGKVDVK